MKALVVINGQYYAGENDQENKLIFEPERAKAVPVDEGRLKYIVHAISEWVMDNEIELRRLEILKEKRGLRSNVQLPKMQRTSI